MWSLSLKFLLLASPLTDMSPEQREEEATNAPKEEKGQQKFRKRKEYAQEN